MTEGEATRKLKRALEEHPRLKDVALVQRHVNTFYTSGVPDLSVSIGTHTIWIELKMYGKRPTKNQAFNLSLLGSGAMLITFSKNAKGAVIADSSMVGLLSARRKIGRKSVWERSQLVEEIAARCAEVGYD